MKRNAHVVDEFVNRRAAQARYRHRRRGIVERPFPALVRQADGKFGVVLLVHDTASAELLVVRWLCSDVTEPEARRMMQ